MEIAIAHANAMRDTSSTSHARRSWPSYVVGDHDLDIGACLWLKLSGCELPGIHVAKTQPKPADAEKTHRSNGVVAECSGFCRTILRNDEAENSPFALGPIEVM